MYRLVRLKFMAFCLFERGVMLRSIIIEHSLKSVYSSGVPHYSLDVDPHRVRHLRVHCQQGVYFPAPSQAMWQEDVDLVYTDEVRLRSSEADFRIRAPDRGDD